MPKIEIEMSVEQATQNLLDVVENTPVAGLYHEWIDKIEDLIYSTKKRIASYERSGNILPYYTETLAKQQGTR